MTTTAHLHSPSTTFAIELLPTTNGTVWAEVSRCTCGQDIGRYEPYAGPWAPAQSTGKKRPGSGHVIVHLSDSVAV